MTSGSDQGSVRPAPGMHVQHRFNPDWGQGMVIAVQGNDARVLFTAHPSRKPALVPMKALSVTRAGTWIEAAAAVNERATRPPTKPASNRPARKYAKTNQTEAVAKFTTAFPGGFADEKYLATERTPKWEAHLAFEEQLGGGALRKLLAEGQVEEAARRTLAVQGKAGLLSVFEKARLNKALKVTAVAGAYLTALADVLEAAEVSEATYAPYLQAVEALGGEAKQRVDSWPIATILPFLAQPARHFILKPIATQAAAERVKVDLKYQSALNWATYQQALTLAATLKESLAPQGCRDFLDVQSFVWTSI